MDDKRQATTDESIDRYSFPPVDPETARFFLREIAWGDHIVGTELNPGSGNRDEYMFSLREALLFLGRGRTGMGYSTGSKGSISWIDPYEYIVWIRDSIGDTTLADALASETAAEDAYYGKVGVLGYLTDLRYAQLVEIVELSEDDAAEADGVPTEEVQEVHPEPNGRNATAYNADAA